MTFFTLAQVRTANKAAGGHFFSPNTDAFWCTAYPEQTIYGGKYFITSDRNFDGSQRRYTIREVSPDGRVDTKGDFLEYPTLGKARKAIAAYLESEQARD